MIFELTWKESTQFERDQRVTIRRHASPELLDGVEKLWVVVWSQKCKVLLESIKPFCRRRLQKHSRRRHVSVPVPGKSLITLSLASDE